MALLACADNVLTAEPRARIGHALHIVCAVAVVTFCGFRVSQLRNLPVIGVEVCFGDFAVTPSALLHDFELESHLVSAPDAVRRMAVDADRQLFLGMSDSMDALIEPLLDAMVAATAGRGDIGPIHA